MTNSKRPKKLKKKGKPAKSPEPKTEAEKEAFLEDLFRISIE